MLSYQVLLIFPLEQMPSEGKLGIVDDDFMYFHEAAHEHVAVLTQVIFESKATVEGAITGWEVSVLEVALR